MGWIRLRCLLLLGLLLLSMLLLWLLSTLLLLLLRVWAVIDNRLSSCGGWQQLWRQLLYQLLPGVRRH